jgi:hypothetical protein
LTVIGAAEFGRSRLHSRLLFERATGLPPNDELRFGSTRHDASVEGVRERHHSFRAGERQRLQQRRIDQCEDGDGCGNG